MPPDPATEDPRPTPPDPFSVWNEAERRYRATLATTPEEVRRLADKVEHNVEHGPLADLTFDELAARWEEAWERDKGRLQPIGPDPTFAIIDELDGWRATYGRLRDTSGSYADLSLPPLPNWQRVAAGAALVGILLLARRIARHGR